ncbi:MAG: bacillithiol biosynthesis deacetylase BshB1 [Imperialibacter sp.]|uniref:bacillithiol biosynthesis deacetylase BshB1 n=1 Tax=Imperialibacter sp. TaxID=2038411 RepID=UPI003A886A48
MKLDILVFTAHPDDAELACAGTLISHIEMGKKVGIVDLTRGELGTRGTPEARAAEATEASKVMGIHVRENLGFRDGFFTEDEHHKLEVVKMIRKYQPEIILANAIRDRHPDHGRASRLVSEASFVSGLRMVETSIDGNPQQPWRAKNVYHYIQSNFIMPDFIVDVSAAWGKKMQAIKCFKSQFYDPASKEPSTFISSPEFMKMLESRGKELGHSIGAAYGEGFTVERHLGVKDLFHLQ